MGFFTELVDMVSKVAESTKYDTVLPKFALEEISNFADNHSITELQFNECIGWEDYDNKLLKIKKLDLSNKNISEIPRYLSLLLEECKIESLSLRQNNIQEIPWNFRVKDCYNLKELDMSHNFISEIPKDFELPWSLTNLNLSFNNISKLPFDYRFSNKIKLKTLNLSNNNFHRSLVYGADLSPDIEYLDLSYNQLSEFNIVCVGKLKILKINNNNISKKLDSTLMKIFSNNGSSYDNNPFCKNTSMIYADIVKELDVTLTPKRFLTNSDEIKARDIFDNYKYNLDVIYLEHDKLNEHDSKAIKVYFYDSGRYNYMGDTEVLDFPLKNKKYFIGYIQKKFISVDADGIEITKDKTKLINNFCFNNGELLNIRATSWKAKVHLEKTEKVN